MAVSINPELLKLLQESTCFGIAHDETVPECKMCDVKHQCKAKTEGGLNIETPITRTVKATPIAEKKTTKKTTTSKTTEKPKSKPTTKKKPAPAKKPKAPEPKGLPVFKDMSLDELKDLAKERDVEWKDYGNDQITRMRLTMALKKSY